MRTARQDFGGSRTERLQQRETRTAVVHSECGQGAAQTEAHMQFPKVATEEIETADRPPAFVLSSASEGLLPL